MILIIRLTLSCCQDFPNRASRLPLRARSLINGPSPSDRYGDKLLPAKHINYRGAEVIFHFTNLLTWTIYSFTPKPSYPTEWVLTRFWVANLNCLPDGHDKYKLMRACTCAQTYTNLTHIHLPIHTNNKRIIYVIWHDFSVTPQEINPKISLMTLFIIPKKRMLNTINNQYGMITIIK